jgi:acetyltransferase-like isoleucine patch superfamily enzyme
MVKIKKMKSHGSGKFKRSDFAKIGKNVVIENGVLIFHPENIELGNNIYIGHNTILKGYHKNKMIIGDGTWIGQQCFFHSAGGIRIGRNVGIGPKVTILTSSHLEKGIKIPILHSGLEFNEVVIKDDCDVGVGAIILPGVEIGKGVQVGAGAVVTKNIPDFEVWAGVPAKFLRKRVTKK